jgi:hypothetical protein
MKRYQTRLRFLMAAIAAAALALSTSRRLAPTRPTHVRIVHPNGSVHLIDSPVRLIDSRPWPQHHLNPDRGHRP